jgi:hypothetical protein
MSKNRTGVRVTTMLALPGKEEEFLHGRIARKAYGLYEWRGRTHGHDAEDWLKAEQLVLTKMKQGTPVRSPAISNKDPNKNSKNVD